MNMKHYRRIVCLALVLSMVISTFTINEATAKADTNITQLTALGITIESVEDRVYTGNEIKPIPVLIQNKGLENEKALVYGTDFTLSYSNNTDLGTATITILGMGEYSFTSTVDFAIYANINRSIANSIATQEYTGVACAPKVKLTYNDVVLTEQVDYTLEYMGNDFVGTGVVKVTGIGNFRGTKYVAFDIEIPSVTTIVKTTDYTNKVVLTWPQVLKASGYEVYKYDFTAKVYKKVKSLGGYTNNTYTEKSLDSGTKLIYKVRTYQMINDEKVYGSFTPAFKMATKTKKNTLTATAGKKKVTLKWTKPVNATGYEIFRATSRHGAYTKCKSISKAATLSYTNSGLTKGKKYYYKVRSYKKYNSVKYYSVFSSIKYAKAK